MRSLFRVGMGNLAMALFALLGSESVILAKISRISSAFLGFLRGGASMRMIGSFLGGGTILIGFLVSLIGCRPGWLVEVG